MAYLKLDDDLAEARKVATRLIDRFAPTSASPKAWLDVESTPNGPQRVHEQLKKELEPADYFVRTFGEVDATPEIDRVEPEVTLSVVSSLEALEIRLKALQQDRNTATQKRFLNKAERQRLQREGQEIGTVLAQQVLTNLSISVSFPEHTDILLLSENIERQLLHCADNGLDPVANRRFVVASQLALQRTFTTNPALQELLEAPNNTATIAGYEKSPNKTVWIGLGDLVGDSYIKACDPNATAEFSREPNRRFLSTAKAQAHELGRTFAATVIKSVGVKKFNEVWAQAPPTPDELHQPEKWLSRRPR